MRIGGRRGGTWRVDLNEVETMLAEMQGEALRARLRPAATEVGLLVQATATPLVPVGATGILRRSLSSDVLSAGPAIVTRVGSPAEHALVMHEGRRPGQKAPPAGALVNWMRFKGMELGELDEKTGYHTRELRLAIAIGRRGIKGRPFLTKAVQQVRGSILDIYARAIVRLS